MGWMGGAMGGALGGSMVPWQCNGWLLFRDMAGRKNQSSAPIGNAKWPGGTSSAVCFEL